VLGAQLVQSAYEKSTVDEWKRLVDLADNARLMAGEFNSVTATFVTTLLSGRKLDLE
jgi:hypothetical protein